MSHSAQQGLSWHTDHVWALIAFKLCKGLHTPSKAITGQKQIFIKWPEKEKLTQA